MSYYGCPSLPNLVGAKVERVFMNQDYLKFETDKGNFVFTVEGDCCSQSVFYDFIGVKKLLENGAITEIKEVELQPDEKERVNVDNGETKIYGYALTTVSPEFGEMTSVFSFRNYSNGYYGGWMNDSSDVNVSPEITDDVIEAVEKPKENS